MIGINPYFLDKALEEKGILYVNSQLQEKADVRDSSYMSIDYEGKLVNMKPSLNKELKGLGPIEKIPRKMNVEGGCKAFSRNFYPFYD